MTPEQKRRKISHGEAVHRRWVLAAARRAAVFDVKEKIIEKSRAMQRLAEINQFLSPDDQTLSTIMDTQEREQTRTGLEVELIWLRFKLGMITPAEKQQALSTKFDELEKANPDVFQWLTSRNENGLSMAERIRDKVIPPIHIGGYYTKR